MRPAILAAIGAAASVTAAHGAEPVRHIGIHVQPYYEAAREAGGRPRVAVGRSYDALLSSAERDDILAARDLIQRDPKLVTPMTMMVLAIRLYDAGLRDDSVFWFYAAKDRYLTLDGVGDLAAAGLGQVIDAMQQFSSLAGPFINGYAFCDVENQKTIRVKALDWVENNPYGAIFMERIPAKDGDRRAALQRAVANVREMAGKERAYLSDPNNVAQMRDSRARNGTDEKFCWK
ncbi:MAG: cytochrome-c oxidase [Alphaproteobacteria bacterium]|nr:MAG: cytochrome-c oxidase [Alphaproteobacteria bacterium]